LGVLAPVVPPYWLGEKPLVELELGTMRHIGPEMESLGNARFTASSLENVRLRHGFVVYSGGRETPSGEQTG
jgi:hypothetical protein